MRLIPRLRPRDAWHRMLAALILVWGIALEAASPTAGPLRVAVVSTSSANSRAHAPLLASVQAALGTGARVTLVDGTTKLAASWTESHCLLVLGGPGGSLSPEDASAFRQGISSAAGVVVIGGVREAWPADFSLSEFLGASSAGPFAGGAPLTVIDLFAHPILSGVATLETKVGAMQFGKLAEDALMIIEGTVGEATTPLAWVHQRGGRRLCHVALTGGDLTANPTYHRLIANAVLWSTTRAIPGARPAVQRTFMPEAHPGSFAITLPEGPSVCFDPVRGGINYIWAGDSVDLRPRWITKQGEAPRIFGEVFYTEKAWRPVRSETAGGSEDFQFRGYTLRDGWPEFHYTVGERDVFESFVATTGGGLLRRLRVGPGGNPLVWQLEPQPKAELVVRGASMDGNSVTFAERAGGEFTIEIQRTQPRLP